MQPLPLRLLSIPKRSSRADGDTRIIHRHWDSLVSYQENLIGHAALTPGSGKGLAECDQFKVSARP